MSTDLTKPDLAPLSTALALVDQQAEHYIDASYAESTRRAYAASWRAFVLWCDEHQMQSLPATPATVARYITVLAERCKPSTIDRQLAAIRHAHFRSRLDSPVRHPEVVVIMRGIRRTKKTAPRKAAPATIEVVRRLVECVPISITGTRDRALLLLGFAGAFRRSELVGLDVEDLQFTNDGLIVHLARSKTDQEGQGTTKGIPYGGTPATCPVRAVRAWLDAAGLAAGALFRPISKAGRVLERRLTDRSVALVIKGYCARAGLDPASFSGHSLRAGLATSAAAAGVPYHTIKAQTGHKSDRVLQGYIREGSLFRENAAARVGL